jgi:hypothetical protein
MAVTRRNKAVVITKPKIALVKPGIDLEIKSVSFPRGYIKLVLTDGTVVLRPVKHYPGIARLKTSQRLKFHLAGGVAIDFDDAPEVYHISDFIGGAIKDFE